MKVTAIFLAVILFFMVAGCEKEQVEELTVDFDYEYLDENHVKFVNLSNGEYYSLDWDFGNGESESGTDKFKSYTVYYPQAGNYNVTLTLLDYTGNKKSASKIVSIDKTDLHISFSANINPLNPNYVVLENTSVGDFESFKWIYRDREILNEESAVAYFPFAGNYEIELQLTKGNDTYSSKQNVTIGQDDPEYVSTFVLTWAEEFEGKTVDSENWTFETGASGWGNNELQEYTNGSNAKVENGILTITAEKEDDNTSLGSYTSSRLNSKGKQEFTYGKMEIRAKLPSGRGIWPAIWMLGANIDTENWPACGELDIMEYVGYQPNTVHATVHTAAGYGANANGSSMTLNSAEEEFHVYGLVWTEKEIKFYVDTPENVVHRYAPAVKTEENWPFNKPQYFVLNVAVGGNWGGVQGIDNSIFPQSMEIDYVRVFQPND